jgi:hypothetical protein
MNKHLRRRIAAVTVTGLVALGGVACDDTTTDDVGDDVEEGVEDLGDGAEDLGEDIEEGVEDLGDDDG